MGKKADVRLNEIYDFVKDNFTAQDSTNLKNKADEVYQNQAQIDSLSEELSLGWRFIKKDAETKRRQAVRALCFASAVNLGTDPDSVRAIVKAKSGWSFQKCIDELTVILVTMKPKQKIVMNQILPAKFTQEGQLQPSFQYANSKEKFYAKDAIEKASELLNRAWVGLNAVKRNVEARAAYELYFGPYDAVRYGTVRTNMKTMHDVLCSTQLKLYYRTGKSVGKPSDLPGAPNGATIPMAVGTGTVDNTFAFVYNPPPGPGVHMFLCRDFFESTHLNRGQDALAGVVIHELSHALCGTNDHTYGPAQSQSLPDDQKITNADNYEYYCESFKA